ncbi:MAG: RNase P subunit p30 family protein [Nanobdellota archaeon]
MIDIVEPQGNEQELVAMAAKLGFTGLVLINGKAVSSHLPVYHTSKSLRIVRIKGEARPSIESGVELIHSVEDRGMKEFMHHRNSGLNQVLCKLAAEKDVAIGFNMRLLLYSPPHMRGIILGRMMQNAAFCRKFWVKQVIASFAKHPLEMRGPYELESLCKVIGIEHTDITH